MTISPYRASSSHIEINGIGLKVIGRIPGQTEVGAQDERKFLLDVPAVYGDFSRGMGASKEHIPGMYNWGYFVDTFSCPGYVLPAGELVEVTNGFVGTAPGPTATIMYAGEPYIMGGRYIYRLDQGAVPSVAQVHDTGANSGTQDAVIFNNDIWVGTFNTVLGSWGALNRFNTATNTWISYGGIARRHLATLDWAPTGTPRKVLIGSDTAFSVKYVYGDPAAAGDWLPSTAVQVTDTGYQILSIVAAPQHAYFGTQGGIHDLDDRLRSPNLTPNWKQEYDINNGGMCLIMDEYIYACHAFGLERVATTGERQDIPEPCNPGQGLGFNGPIYGRPVAGCTYRGWVVVGFYNSSPTVNQTYICFGKDKNHAGVDVPGGPMVWHGAYAVVEGRATSLSVVSEFGFNPQLVIGVANPADAQYHLYLQSLPQAANALQELRFGGGHRYATDAALYLADGWPQHPTGYRDIWTGDIEGQQMKGSQHITVEANQNDEDTDLDGEPDWSEIGHSQAQGAQSFITPEDFGSAARVTLKVSLIGTAEQPPVFLSLRLRADINFQLSDVRTYHVDLRDDGSTTIGTLDVASAYSQLQRLKELCNRTSTRVSMRDEFNDVWTVRVLDVTWPEDMLDQNDLVLQPTITVRFLTRSAGYDSNELYDRGVPYAGDAA